jgi:hypothetical protein
VYRFSLDLRHDEIFSPSAEPKFVMPANAGIQIRFGSSSKTAWIPASAGMTE